MCLNLNSTLCIAHQIQTSFAVQKDVSDTYNFLMNPSFNNLAVTCYRCESMNVIVVVLDKFVFGFQPLYSLGEANQAM